MIISLLICFEVFLSTTLDENNKSFFHYRVSQKLGRPQGHGAIGWREGRASHATTLHARSPHLVHPRFVVHHNLVAMLTSLNIERACFRLKEALTVTTYVLRLTKKCTA